MNNRIVGFFLISLTLLTAVIAYSIGELIDTIKASSAYIAGTISESGGGDLSWGGNPPVSIVPILLIMISFVIGVFLLRRNET